MSRQPLPGPIAMLTRTSLATIPLCLLTTAPALAQCTQWGPYGSGTNNTVLAVRAMANGDLVVGGVFNFAGGAPASRIARWNGTAWSPLGSGMDANVRSLTELPNGDLIAGGDFLVAGGVAANRIARWDGASWLPLGLGVSSPANPSAVTALATMGNGDVVAAGFFQQAGGAAANAIARWNGSSWSPLASGILGSVFCLLPMPNGDVVAGGNFTIAGGSSVGRIARWNGTAWSTFGTGMSGLTVFALARLPNGDLVAGGNFTAAGGVPANNIARWNGSSWSPLGSGMDATVRALATMPNGDVIAGGQFTTAGGIPAVGMARWNGTAWSSLGFAASSEIYSLHTAGNGDRVLGGFFSNAGGTAASFVARYRSTCPATAVGTGAGCAGAGGANDYAALSAPWLGTTYRARGTGLPSVALAAVVSGATTTSLPLAALLLPAPANCTLLVAPDFVDLVVPTAGSVDTTITIPTTPALVGSVLHQQLVLIELHPITGAVVEHTTSNRLTVTVGAF
jgi:trimeric autotransporter adhesin